MKTRMKSTITAITFITALLATGCATLAPKEDRVAVFVENTTVPKSTAYSHALAYFAKTFRDANHAIQVRDEAGGQIVANGNVTCNELRQMGDSNDYSLSFTLDFQAKDNRVRIAFEELTMMDHQAKPVTWANNQITDKSKVDAVKPCLDPIRTGLLKAVAGSSENW
jgi:hypothetical protein